MFRKPPEPISFYILAQAAGKNKVAQRIFKESEKSVDNLRIMCYYIGAVERLRMREWWNW